MDILLSKSESNNSACILLYGKEFYNSAVHCAYYRCLQHMISILKIKNSWSDTDIQNQIELKKEGSHQYYINSINSIVNERKFHNKISELKLLRVKADYKSEDIESSDCEMSIKYSDNIVNMLKNIKI